MLYVYTIPQTQGEKGGHRCIVDDSVGLLYITQNIYFKIQCIRQNSAISSFDVCQCENFDYSAHYQYYEEEEEDKLFKSKQSSTYCSKILR